MLVDMDTLRETHPRLYRTVVKYHFNLRETFGEQEIDESRLSEFTRGELRDWLSSQPAPIQPAEPLPPQLDLDAEFKADLQKAVDQQQGIDRLQRFADEDGLEPSPETAQIVQEFLDRELKGYWSEKGVELAILNNGPRGTNRLKFRLNVAPPPPAPAQPVEALGTLRNGEPRLPLDIDERSMKSSSVPQLKDLVERRRAATNQRYIRRGHGASF
jgi:hypothetical protein